MSLKNEEAIIRSAGGRTPPETQPTVGGLELNHPAIPPINKLPSEVLADIMEIVASLAPCLWTDRWYITGPPPVVQYPDALAQVCSHWRQVAMQSCRLWSHIDLATWMSPSRRATALLERAGQSPLSLHVVGHCHTPSVDLVPFLAPITSQLKSLGLLILPENLSEARTSLLHTCLLGCMAGNLKELNIRFINQYELSTPFFIAARDYLNETITSTHNSRSGEWVLVDTPRKHLEDLLEGVSVLRLNQIYPEWMSSAYHGLVELRLLGGRRCGASITESQLISVLRHSPELRILHFDLVIVDLAPLDTTIGDPIVLKDLEILNLDWAQGNGVEIFFRWLAPCPKLFQFSFRPRIGMNVTHPATVAFLASSNITMINADNCSLQEVVDLVDLCPRTRVLAISNNSIGETRDTLPPGLHTLCLIKSVMRADCLHRWILSCPIQRLILYGSDISRNGTGFSYDQVPVNVFSDVCSEIAVFPKDGPSPIEGWEVFWDYQHLACITCTL